MAVIHVRKAPNAYQIAAHFQRGPKWQHVIGHGAERAPRLLLWRRDLFGLERQPGRGALQLRRRAGRLFGMGKRHSGRPERIGLGGYRESSRAPRLNGTVDPIGHPPIPAAGARRILVSTAKDLLETIENLSADFSQEMRPLDNLIGEVATRLNATLGLDLALRERDAHVVRGGGWNFSE